MDRSRQPIGVAFVAATLANLTFFLVSTFAPRVRAALAMSGAMFGAALSTRFVLAAAFALPIGRLVGRRGPRFGIAIGCLTMAVGSIAIALSRGWLLFVVGVATAGVTAALLNTSSDVLIARAVPRHRQGIVFGIKQGGAPAAALLSGLALAVLGKGDTWRWVFASIAVIAVVLVVAIPAASGANDLSTTSTVVDQDVRARTTRTLAVAMFFGGTVLGGFAAFAVSGAISAGVAEPVAATLLAIGSVLSVVVRLAVGALADRRSHSLLRLVALMLATGAVAFVLAATNTPAGYVAGIPLAFATSFGFSGVFALAVVRANPASPAHAVAVTQTGANLGAMAGPVAFGLLVSRSYTAAWLVAAALSAVAAMLMLLGRRQVRRDVEARLAPAPPPLGGQR